MDVFVARQPIFDRLTDVQAYELLYRSASSQSSYDGTDGDEATTQVLANSLLSIGLESLLCGKKAFVNFDRKLLLGGLHSILPPETLVIEILETVEPDCEVLAACRKIRADGYAIALDDTVFHHQAAAFGEVVNILKVDMLATSAPEHRRILNLGREFGLTMLAEKVETQEDFERARQAGYQLFQGYFFARPHTVRGQKIEEARVTCVRLLREMQKPELELDRIKALIEADVSLSYQLLRYVNSALFAFRAEISAIDRALMMLGETNVRHWISLAALPTLAKNKPSELVVSSLVRARFCELLGGIAGCGEPHQAYLTGLFSFLDVLLGLPLIEALDTVGVNRRIRDALLGRAAEGDLIAEACRIARAYEAGEWDTITSAARDLRLKPAAIAVAYSDSTLWAQQAIRATGRKVNTRRETRYPLRGSIQVLCQLEDGYERMLVAQVTNVSMRGLQLVTLHPLPLRARVLCNDLKLQISGCGSVRHCSFSKGKYVIGLEFSGGTGFREPGC